MIIDILVITAGAFFTGLFCYGIYVLIFEDWR